MANLVYVSEKTFESIKSAENTWQAICEHEYDFTPYMPALAGGLDHINISKRQITVHDIGCNGRDCSFIVRVR
jgi:cytochrome b involved in lipid metabolism